MKKKKVKEKDEYICERCARPHSDPPQKCEHCGMDGLCNGCIGTIDHACESEG